MSLAAQVQALLTGQANGSSQGVPLSSVPQLLASPLVSSVVNGSAFASLVASAEGSANVPDYCAVVLGLPALPSPQNLAGLPDQVLASVPTSLLATLPVKVLVTLPVKVLVKLPARILVELPTSVLSQLPASVLSQLPTPVPSQILAAQPTAG